MRWSISWRFLWGFNWIVIFIFNCNHWVTWINILLEINRALKINFFMNELFNLIIKVLIIVIHSKWCHSWSPFINYNPFLIYNSLRHKCLESWFLIEKSYQMLIFEYIILNLTWILKIIFYNEFRLISISFSYALLL